ncbi:MAG: hypothetical protein DWQ47_09850 [Acidobacteria bacterium]|nr:MAG: hypothetical protein DWQ32_12265 [Acidobacteriota bacterium]REJ98707.1 MAG: hypothetical protein DWQ38_15215 [Acidobacteriota bacterium]REK16638.1 MAG: hypothetical protein DWQ43_00110 [Acidobacteriota bacterium]REK42549.1 MAG: hypothetical protein DWQ47_09850 [Acidobacteriota bacterium]
MKIRIITFATCIVLAVGGATNAFAQNGSEMKDKKSDKYAKDVESLDSIVDALYDSISGGAGVERDWDRFHNLFVEDARLIPTGKDQASGLLKAFSLSPAGYVERSGPFLVNNGFFEKEIARKTETFGNIVHIFSTYEGRRKESDEKAFLRGINSIQLLNDGKRWWIVTVYWQAESPDNPLPAKYLPAR